jgi:hypothetical protein
MTQRRTDFKKWMVTAMRTLWKKLSRNLDAPLIYPALILFAVWVFAANNAAAATAPSTQVTFATPSEAGQALQAANQANDEKTLQRILGPGSQTLVNSGDAAEDKAARHSFVSKYNQMNRWVAMTDGTEVLYIGADNYPFPIPLAQGSDSRWHFDMAAGEQEILARRIGRNELLAIDACLVIAIAEDQYSLGQPNSSAYAPRIVSSAGNQDGLYWPASAAQPTSPLAALAELPESSAGSLASGQPVVLDGYTFRILTRQGDAAPGGAKSYIVNGKMTGGFAILATPVKYGKTGIMTFITGRDGVIYERDLGPDSYKIASLIEKFDPTEDWTPVE